MSTIDAPAAPLRLYRQPSAEPDFCCFDERHWEFAPELPDQARLDAFSEALTARLCRGMRVLQLGGRDTLLALLAARLEAEVWCVEPRPLVADATRRAANEAGLGRRLHVVAADPGIFLPPEPADLLVCATPEPALLRSFLVPALRSLDGRHRRRFGRPLPEVLPGRSVLAIEPVAHCFGGRRCRVGLPECQDPELVYPETRSLGSPEVYQRVDYAAPLPAAIRWQGDLHLARKGTFNAVRLLTRHTFARWPGAADGLSFRGRDLIVPLSTPVEVCRGQALRVSLAYRPGGPLSALCGSLFVEDLAECSSLPTAA